MEQSATALTRGEQISVHPPIATRIGDLATARPLTSLLLHGIPFSQNVACRWIDGNGGVEALVVVYVGPLVDRDSVCIRFGVTLEDGRPWQGIRDLKLHHEPRGCVATLGLQDDGRVSAVQFAFYADNEWDNGGHPMGYYEWRRSGEVVVVG